MRSDGADGGGWGPRWAVRRFLDGVVLVACKAVASEIVGRGDLLATRERDTEKLEKYLFQFKLESWEKKRILQDWDRIAAGELSLSRYSHLSEAQRSVLESLLL